jgi:o-succinylbenzoate synthase
MGIRLEQITLREIRMPLVHFFETSFGRTTERCIVLVEVQSGGVSGWG